MVIISVATSTEGTNVCLKSSAEPRRNVDDEAHILLHCPELSHLRLGSLWGLLRFFCPVSSDHVVPVQGVAGLLPLFRAILDPENGRVDVWHAYQLGKFLEKAWRYRAAV